MTIPQAFDLALQHHRAGRLAEAEALYREILAVESNNADALHLLGLVAHQAGRHDLAVEWIRQSIFLNPNNSAAYSNLGIALDTQGKIDEAIAAYRRALELKPDSPEAHVCLGAALSDQGQFDEAIVEYRRALELKPDYPEAHSNLGNALRERGQLDEAVAACRHALALKPDFPEAHNNLGAALRKRGELDEAVAAYHRALQLKPDYVHTYINLGNALTDLRQFDEAIAAYGRAVELKPHLPEAYSSLGCALWKRGQLDEAIAACRHALELKPDFPEAHNDMGNALKDQGNLNEAIAAFRRALEIKPNDTSTHSNLVYALHYHPGHSEGTVAEEHQRWNRQFSDPLNQFVMPHTNDRTIDRRLRVGYVSPDFRNHPAGRYLLPLFERHDRQGIEIFCYSGVARSDWMTERLRAFAAVWRNTVGVSDARLAEMIREEGVDILVDLSLHTGHNRLPVFARHPAPVQVTWLGYPGSSGLPSIEYRLTDAHMDPPGEKPAWSAEEPLRLPDCWCCYHPVDESPEINALPAFSSQGVTFGSLNNFAKVHEGVLGLWTRVLEAVTGSRLLIFCPEGRTRERVRAFFGARGISGERLELVGHSARRDYLRRYHRIDLALDPFPCNGMTTTCDALWMGVPVLTLPGTMPVSRAGLSLLSTIGLGELVTYSEEDYVRTAVELARDLPRLANMRATLRPRMLASPLMDAPRFARNVEAAYRSMWERWCAGQTPICKE
jgi:protein O-GlcNAc transferase